MSLTGRLIRAATSGLKNPEHWVVQALGGGGVSKSGVMVGDNEAYSSTAVLCCVRALVNGVSMLPLHLYFDDGSVKEKALKHSLYWRLHKFPNPELTKSELMSWVMNAMLMYGDAYLEKETNFRKQIVGLWPLMSGNMIVSRPDPLGPIRYEYHDSGRMFVYGPENIVHIRGFYPGGLCGMSLKKLGCNAIGLSIALEEYGSTFFTNNAMPKGYIKHPGELRDEARDRVRKKLQVEGGGLTNSHRLSVLDEGMSWEQTGVSPGDAQMVEQRKFQILEMCRLFDVPPHRSYELSGAIKANIEEQGREFVTYSIGPFLVRIEERFDASLLVGVERYRYYTKFNVDALTRAAMKDRYDAYHIALQDGLLQRDECRAKEDMNPLPKQQGEVVTVALNMQNLLDMTPGAAAAKAKSEPRMNTDEHGYGVRAKTERGAVLATWRPKIVRAYEALGEWERAEILKGAGAAFGGRGLSEWNSWLDDFRFALIKQFGRDLIPVHKNADDAFAQFAASQLDGVVPVEMDSWIAGILQYWGKQHAGDAVKELERIRAGAGEGEVLAEIERRMETWVDAAKARGADRVTQSDGAIAREVWRRKGVKKLIWLTGGKPCPLCASLSGKVIGIEESFVKMGDTVEGEGVAPLHAGADILHCPLHNWCVCSIGIG
jgi:HK97 family phage portal protein